MTETFFSLAVICAITFGAPFVCSLIPGGWVQSSALVLLLGAVFGPHMLAFIDPGAPGLLFLQQLGLAFLFLMGGYELRPSEVMGRTGRHAAVSWLFSFAVALALLALLAAAGPLPEDLSANGWIALAIALTSTSYGKVNAVLKERNARESKFGQVVVSYGATGELLPIVAIAILLADENPLTEIVIIVIFCLAALAISRIAAHERAKGTLLDQTLRHSSNAPQLLLQLTILILVVLVCLGLVLGADMIVAGFAAGFVLRKLVDDDQNETGYADAASGEVVNRLRGIANGFFIPIVFVLTGTNIDIVAGLRDPLVVLGAIGLLLLVRGVPVDLALKVFPETRSMSNVEQASVAAYSCMVMGTVVAMTSVAVQSGDMGSGIAGTLVFAAALTSIFGPLVTRVLARHGGGPLEPVDAGLPDSEDELDIS